MLYPKSSMVIASSCGTAWLRCQWFWYVAQSGWNIFKVNKDVSCTNVPPLKILYTTCIPKTQTWLFHITQSDDVTQLHPIIRTECVLQSNPATGCFYEPDGPSEKQSRALSIKDTLTATVLLGCYVHLTTLDVIQHTQEMIVWLINSLFVFHAIMGSKSGLNINRILTLTGLTNPWVKLLAFWRRWGCLWLISDVLCVCLKASCLRENSSPGKRCWGRNCQNLLMIAYDWVIDDQLHVFCKYA